MADRPRGRQRNVTGGSQGVHRRGQGLGTGPVGAGANGGYSGRPSGSFQSSSGDGNAPKRSGSRMPILAILLLLIFG